MKDLSLTRYKKGWRVPFCGSGAPSHSTLIRPCQTEMEEIKAKKAM